MSVFRTLFGATDPKLSAMVQTLKETVQQTTASDSHAVAQIGQKADNAAAAAAAASQGVVTLQQLSDDYAKQVAASVKDRAALHEQLDQVAARKPTQAVGRVATPLLALGASQDLVVPLSRPLPAATYDVDVLLATALLGKATAMVKERTKTSVTVTFKATLALTATASVDVYALHYG